MVRALRSHQCGPGSIPKSDAICGLSLLLVLSLAPRGFSPGTPVFPSPHPYSGSSSTSQKLKKKETIPPNRYLFYLFFYILRFTRCQSTMSNE